MLAAGAGLTAGRRNRLRAVARRWPPTSATVAAAFR